MKSSANSPRVSSDGGRGSDTPASSRGKKILLGLGALAATLVAATTVQLTGSSVGTELSTPINKAQPGQTIRLGGGQYKSVWVGTKTFNPPVVVEGTPGEVATIPSVTLVNMDGIIFRNVVITGTYQARGSRNIEVSNSQVRAVQVRDSSYNALIKGNRITDGADGVWIRNIDNTKPWNSQITITGNDISGQSADGVYMAHADHVLVEGNKIHDTYDTTNHNDGVQVSGGRDVTIRNNRLDNHDESIILKAEPDLFGAGTTVTNTKIENNLMVRNRGAGLILGGGTQKTYIANNTAGDNLHADIHVEGWNSDYWIWNNVLHQIYLLTGASAPAYENFNCVRWKGGTGDKDIIGQDPQFIDHIDYRLASTSLCRGNGTTKPVLPSPDGPTADFSGASRTSPWDAGAWQDSPPTTVMMASSRGRD